MAKWSIGICMLAKDNGHGQHVLSEIVMDIGKMIAGNSRELPMQLIRFRGEFYSGAGLRRPEGIEWRGNSMPMPYT